MRTITAAQQAVLNAGVQAEFCRVKVKDGSGTERDLTTYPTFNAVKSVRWSASVNDATASFEVTLFRELYKFSLSPYVTGSALNKGFNPAAAFSALIAAGRELIIECAIVGMDRQPSAGDWFEVLRGRIEKVDTGSDDGVVISGKSKITGRLGRQFIKTERVYSFAVDGGHAVPLRVWEPNQDYALNEYLLPASRAPSTSSKPDDPGYNKFLKNSQAGTSGTTEPIWTGGAGQVDGTAKWDYIGAPSSSGNPVEQVMQNILDDNKAASDSSITLFTPASPGWDIKEFIQQREFTLDALLALAHQIGWDLRDKWRSGTAQFELTFYQPERSSPSVDFTFGKSDYGTLTELGVDITTIRNAVRVWYGDAADLWPDGTPKRKKAEVSDATSITKYSEELWMEMQEDQTGGIDSSTEANTLANAALSDLKDPTAELAVPLMRGFPWVELNDYYTFSANGLQFDADQSLAVTEYTHTFESGKMRTELKLRGKPTIGADAWLGKRVNPRVPPKFFPHQQVQFNGAQTPAPTITRTVGGHRVELSQDFDKKQLPEEYEHHVYTTSGAALDSTTLRAVEKGRTLEISDLIPDKTYYYKVVPRFRNADRIIRGQPSAEATFVAGQASAGHLVDGVAWGDYPLNGGFENRNDGSNMPDHWEIYAGALGTDVDVMEDGSGLSGNRYIRLKTHSGGIRSAIFPIVNEAMESSRRGGLYRMSWWRKAGASNSALATYDTLVRLLDYAGAEVDIVTVAAGLACDDRKGHWVLEQVFVQLRAGDSGARSAQLQIIGRAGATFQLDVDEYRVQFLGSPWFEVGDTSDFTDAYESIPNFDNSYQAHADSNPAFRRDQFGKVHLKGAYKHVTTTTVGSSLVTLPTSFWPKKKKSFIVPANGKRGLIEVSTAGVVTLVSADDANPSTKIVLDGISYDVHETA